MGASVSDVSQLDWLVPVPSLRHRLDGQRSVRRNRRRRPQGKAVRSRSPRRFIGADAELCGSGLDVSRSRVLRPWGWRREAPLGRRQFSAGPVLGSDGAC